MGEHFLDCTDLKCPMPIIEATKKIRNLEPGEILKIVSTDNAFRPDIEAWSRKTGHAIESFSNVDGKFVALIKKS